MLTVSPLREVCLPPALLRGHFICIARQQGLLSFCNGRKVRQGRLKRLTGGYQEPDVQLEIKPRAQKSDSLSGFNL